MAASNRSSASGLGCIFLICLPIFIIGFFIAIISAVLNSGDQPEQQGMPVSYEKGKGFPQVAQKFYPIYKSAEKKYNVPWNILAGIHRIETNFSQNLNTSSVGATGHTQFMDKTWVGWGYPGGTGLGDLPNSVDITDLDLIKKYGGQGVDANGNGKADPMEPEDAIFATAKYLSSNHSPGEDWFARNGPVYQYNHDYLNYVLPVKRYAESYATPVAGGTGGPAKGSGKFIWPIDNPVVTSKYGYRPRFGKNHTGIDFDGEDGVTPIKAADGGEVIRSSPSSGYGWLIIIDHKNGYFTRYAHMWPNDVFVQKGQKVSKGKVIGKTGNNGNSFGAHLHFEIMVNNPSNGFVNPLEGNLLPKK